MSKVRIGIVGVGVMGEAHLKTLSESKLGVVTAVCDTRQEVFENESLKGLLGDTVAVYADYKEMMDSGKCDCVAIVSPHPTHLEMVEYAFKAGLHVMCDKPITITTREADKMIKLSRETGLKFCTMYTLRTSSCNQIVREWIKENRLGDVKRVEMTCTEWLRTQKYYDVQKWRGTWQGEGAGLLLNQATHNLDLLYWWFGSAKTIFAKAKTRFHEMETEDDVFSIITTQNDVPIYFYSTTGEAPGKDYLEIVGSKGTLIREKNTLRFKKLAEDSDSFIKNSETLMGRIDCEDADIEVPDTKRGHGVVFEDFFDAILRDRSNDSLIAPGEEGIHAVEWANAMLISSIKGKDVSLPIDRVEYDELLDELRSKKITL